MYGLMEEVCKLMADYINQRNGLEYSVACGDFWMLGSGKELYNKRQELDRMLNEISDKLNKLGYPIYVCE